MIVERLDPKTISSLEPRKARYFAIEKSNPGFAVAISPKGGRSWAYSYKRPIDGRPTYLAIAPCEAMSRDEALPEYLDLRKLRLQDVDPATRRKEEKAAARAELEARTTRIRTEAFTVSALVDFYEQHHAKRSLGEDLRMLRKDVLPVLGGRPATEVTPDDVQALVDGIADRGAPRSAGLTLAALRKAYGVAKKRRKVKSNPCIEIDAPKQGTRDRNLTRAELRKLQGGLDAAIPSEDVRDVMRLMLLTAVRKGEAVAVEWSEIDWDERVWSIPREKAKNKHPHRVMFSEQTAAFFRRRWQGRSKPSPFVFPTRRERRGNIPNKVPHLRGDAINDALDKHRDALGIAHFAPHDLRRTALTHLGRMGCPRIVQDRISNHVDRSIGGVYDRHQYDLEAREWLQKLADFLDELKPAGEVVALAAVAE